MLVSGLWFLTGHLGSLGSLIKHLTTWQLDSREGKKEGGRGRAREDAQDGRGSAMHPAHLPVAVIKSVL